MLRYLAVAATTGALFLSGCSNNSPANQPPAAPTALPTSATYTIHGTISAAPAHLSATGTGDSSACDDYKLENAAVTVRDEYGTILAATTTSANATPKPTEPPADEQADIRQHGFVGASAKAQKDEAAYFHAYFSCTTMFTAAVPQASFYQLTVGTHGATVYSFEDLKAKGFHVDLSLR